MRILDLTQVLAGPFCTMILADLGADVIKVEAPGVGDPNRRWFGDPAPGHDSPGFFAVNRNKRSVCLDLKTEPGVAALIELSREVDVVVEAWRPGVATRLGIGYERLAETNPALVYASISGFGQWGPYSERPGYDLIAQAMAGIMSVSGEPDAGPGRSALPIGDLGAGMFCAIGILAAYNHSQRTGQGQRIETSLFEVCVAMSVWESVEYWSTGQIPTPIGSAHRATAPYQPLRTRNGHIAVAANNERIWRDLCATLGTPELAEHEDYASNALRMKNRHQLIEVLETCTSHADTEHWLELLLSAGIPAAPLQNYQQVLDVDEHVRERGMVQVIDHPIDGPIKVLGSPLKMSATPPQIHRAPPMLGQHTAEILNEGLIDSRHQQP
jgi:formyl-CoA transferase